MHPEAVRPLDQETLDLFAAKGLPERQAPGQGWNLNAVKVRRVMQLLRDLGRPQDGALRVLDLACGEGVYSIEAALRGAEVLAVDARTERMAAGVRAARRLGLDNLRFEQQDIRRVTAASHGSFDVILLLGILYHLDESDLLPVLENIRGMCRQFVIIDTHVSLEALAQVQHRGRTYLGRWYREHGDQDSAEVRRQRLTASLDNCRSFWPTRSSLVAMLCEAGFTSVVECHLPREPSKPGDRVTLVAAVGAPVRVSTYPWINEMNEGELERVMAGLASAGSDAGSPSVLGRVRRALNLLLRPLRFQISRL